MSADRHTRRPPSIGGITRRQMLRLGAVAAALPACDRFDFSSWVTRDRHDVDARFTSSTTELSSPLPPPVPYDDAWSMLVVSDFHCWEGERPATLDRVEAYLERDPVDFVVQLGDLADAGWAGEYDTGRAALERLGLPFFCAIGNHDLFHEGWVSYRQAFGPSAYVLPVGASLLVFMDLGGGTLGGLQRPWLEDQLAAAAADHVFLLSHYPMWDSVSMGFAQLGSEQEVYDILDLMRRYEVRAHFSGHTHRWARTECSGVQLYTVGAIKESAPGACGLRVAVEGAAVTYTRVPLNGEG